jgi:hypothetical protein
MQHREGLPTKHNQTPLAEGLMAPHSGGRALVDGTPVREHTSDSLRTGDTHWQ